MALSAAGSETLAYEVGKVGAIEGRAIGIHLTYSPVVDVQTRPDNPVLSVRSFGSDVELLGTMASAYIRGYQENGMLATAKHFPGRGDVDLMGDTEFLINSKPASRIEAEDLAAFKKAIDAGVTFVMSEHIAIPSLTDGSDLPASVEAKLASYWLRERLGFENVLTTDDLWYPKVVDRFGAERAGVLAIRAGHDVLLKPQNAIKMIDAVARAVRGGEIAIEQIDHSVEKLLYWKARLKLHRERFVDVERVSSVVGSKAHRDLVREVAERSLTTLVNDDFFPTNVAKLGTMVHISLQKNEHNRVPVEVASKLADAMPIEHTWMLRPNMDPRLRDEAAAAARRVDTVIVSLFRQRNVYRDNGAFDATDAAFLREIIAADSRAVILSYGNPYLVEGLEDADAFVVGYGEGGFYGNQSVYADAFIRLLKGEIEARGKLPVSLSSTRP
jgi:beta-N-acetylhexosaminidase